jgi:hypothetical protein
MLSSLVPILADSSSTLVVVAGAVCIGFGIWYLVHRNWLWGLILTIGGILLGGLHVLDVL